MLLKDVEQEITGKWSFFDVIVHGNFNNTYFLQNYTMEYV